VDIFHVEIVGRNCVGYGVLGENLGLLHRVSGCGFRKERGGAEFKRTGSLALGQAREGGNRALLWSQPSNLDCLVEGTSLV
jgi:hypothetical protein